MSGAAETAPLPWGARAKLPHRRPNNAVTFEFAGLRYVGHVGVISPAQPVVREIFLNQTRQDSALDDLVCEAATAVSIALQYGAPAAVLAAAMRRRADGAPRTALGYLLDMVLRGDFDPPPEPECAPALPPPNAPDQPGAQALQLEDA